MTAGEVRQRVTAGDYAGAAACFDEYARGLAVSADALAQLEDLLRWTTATVLCGRAHAEGALQELRDRARVSAAYERAT